MTHVGSFLEISKQKQNPWQQFSNFSEHQSHLAPTASPRAQSLGAGGLGWGREICIPSLVLGDAAAAGRRTALHAGRLSGVSVGKCTQWLRVRTEEAGITSSASSWCLGSGAGA